MTGLLGGGDIDYFRLRAGPGTISLTFDDPAVMWGMIAACDGGYPYFIDGTRVTCPGTGDIPLPGLTTTFALPAPGDWYVTVLRPPAPRPAGGNVGGYQVRVGP